MDMAFLGVILVVLGGFTWFASITSDVKSLAIVGLVIGLIGVPIGTYYAYDYEQFKEDSLKNIGGEGYIKINIDYRQYEIYDSDGRCIGVYYIDASEKKAVNIKPCENECKISNPPLLI